MLRIDNPNFKVNKFERVFLIVLDGLGVGEMADSSEYGDKGANTLAHIGDAVNSFALPNLQRWGLGNITKVKGIPTEEAASAFFGKANEESKGKDTTTGHWEIAGIITEVPFATYPKGFDKEIIEAFCKKINVPGILGNKTASGTEIIQEFGEEHIRTGKPIVYTSADSVFQIAAHEKHFGLTKLYEACEAAREICDRYNISRVIARPFLGVAGKFSRTENRKDYSIKLPKKMMLERIKEKNLEVVGIGKIPSIYNYVGFTGERIAKTNEAVMSAILRETNEMKRGLCFANLVDFDMLYGHRRDPHGYAKALHDFDAFIPSLEDSVTEKDLIIVVSDHGNDPLHAGSDHTREHVPVLIYSKAFGEPAKGRDLGVIPSFSVIGDVIEKALGVNL